MQIKVRKRRTKNIILKSITGIAVMLFVAAACAVDCTTSWIPVYALFGCLAWFWLFAIANNFFRGV